MKKFLFSLAAITVVMAALTSSASAGPHGSSGSHSSHMSHGSSQGGSTKSSFSTKNGNGTNSGHLSFYQGQNHNHWSASRYDSRYGCQLYYDPYCTSWYYWCQPACCYYPISYCPYQTYCWNAPGAAQVPFAAGSSNFQGQPNMPGPSNFQGQPNMPGPSNFQGQPNMPGPSNFQGQPNMPGPSNFQGQPNMPGPSNFQGQPKAGNSNQQPNNGAPYSPKVDTVLQPDGVLPVQPMNVAQTDDAPMIPQPVIPLKK